MNNNIYYLAEKPWKSNHAGNKARFDVDEVLKNRNYTPFLCMEDHVFLNLKEKIRFVISPEFLNRIRSLCAFKSKKLIMQYPIYADFITRSLIRRLIRKNDTILFVHDINCIRYYDEKLLALERDVLNSAKLLIVHNKYMEDKLKSIGVDTDMISLGLFDYLLDDVPNKCNKLSNTLAFAGNLNKSAFLKRNVWNDSMGIHINLYGPNYNRGDYIEDFEYQGCLPPDKIPFEIKGSFGLLWDGDSLNTCSGEYGEYMKYNNPHKLSLYIASCLPVIVWEKAAVAELVKEEKIGFCVSKISDISTLINNLSEDEYNECLINIKRIQHKVVTGWYTNLSLNKAL